MTRDFYNTIGLAGNDLKDADAQAKTQNERILEFFQDNRGMLYSPFEVHAKVFGQNSRVPVTSVRRSLTNLTHLGYINKTSSPVVNERLGKSNHAWYMPTTDELTRQLSLF